jgi:hypothetical protein
VIRVISAQKLPTIGGERSRQSGGDGDPDGGGEEVLHRQPGHLRQVAERCLAAVELPVGVGDEADRRVERQVRVHAGEVLRIERQNLLNAQNGVEQGEPGEAEGQHGKGVGQPALALLRLDPGRAIKNALHRLQHRGEPSALALPHAGHIETERPTQRHRDADREDDLGPTLPIHEGVFRLELFGLDQRPDHVDADA